MPESLTESFLQERSFREFEAGKVMFEMFSGFLNSVYFGITAMVIVGSSWCLVGLVMGDAPKKNVDTSMVQFFGAAFSCLVSLILWITAIPTVNCSLSVLFLACGVYALGTFMNFHMLQFMSAAMQLGPNGVIWSIIQSAFIFPFIGGILFFDVKFTFLRGIGIFLLLAALFCFGRVKDNSVKGSDGKWKKLAFICFGIVAIQQNLTTAPSYFEEAREIPSIIRTLANSFGVLLAAAISNGIKISRQPEFKEVLKKSFFNRHLWKYVCALQFFSLIFAYTLQFPGMDVMAKAGLGGMCYPTMVGSCIVSFTLSSVFILKEKVRKIQMAALALCILGLILICLPA